MYFLFYNCSIRFEDSSSKESYNIIINCNIIDYFAFEPFENKQTIGSYSERNEENISPENELINQ